MSNKIIFSLVVCGLVWSGSFGADSWQYGTNQIITSGTSTKLGVGMNSGTPAEKLTVSAGNMLLDYNYWIKGKTSSGSAVSMLGLSNSNFTSLGGNNISISTPGTLSMFAYGLISMTTSVGGVAIGGTALSRKLDINSGDIRIRGTTNFTSSANPPKDSACVFFGDEFHWIKARRGLGVQIGSWDGNTGSKAGLTVHQATTSGGACYVGINTANPQSELAVAGTITAKAVTVTLSGWSDFVFNNNYNLKPLSDVENYIKTNNHLEGIPSEKEVKSKGLQLGDMQAKLLQKVEELTLYAIEQNKRIDELAKVNKVLMMKLESSH